MNSNKEQPNVLNYFVSGAIKALADHKEKRKIKEIEELQKNIFSTINLGNE